MITDIQEQIDKYTSWLRDKTVLREIDDCIEITTPFLDRHNDYIQIYATKDISGFVLTDDGFTIDDLEMCGCKLNSPKRQGLLKITLNGFGVQMASDGKLIVKATLENFPQRKHNLIQAILAVNDMFYLAKPYIESVFYEDVVAWLDLNEVRYTPRVKFTGRTGFDHLFDFVIPKSRIRPERIVNTINRPSRSQAEKLVLSWLDTREVRPADSVAYAILNDADQEIPGSVIEALVNYDIRPVCWSNREIAGNELAA